MYRAKSFGAPEEPESSSVLKSVICKSNRLYVTTCSRISILTRLKIIRTKKKMFHEIENLMSLDKYV